VASFRTTPLMAAKGEDGGGGWAVPGAASQTVIPIIQPIRCMGPNVLDSRGGLPVPKYRVTILDAEIQGEAEACRPLRARLKARRAGAKPGSSAMARRAADSASAYRRKAIHANARLAMGRTAPGSRFAAS